MTLLSLVLMNTGCGDKIDNPAIDPSTGKTVVVTFNLGIADEVDGAEANASPVTKASSNKQSAFEVLPVADVRTKTDAGKPDLLYNLEIIQYKSDGTITSQTIGNQTIGAPFTVSLSPDNGCQLLIVARGANSGFSALGSKTLADVQKIIVKAKDSNINAIATDATGNALANMPYFLYLKNVNISSDGKIQSPEGYDVRLMLKRLAVKVQLDWTFNQTMADAGYTLKEVRLCQTPAHYRLVPQTESTDKWGDVYPTSVAEFVDVYRLTGTALADANGSKIVWMPANSRGISAYATSPLYRNKDNANSAATYAEFVVDNEKRMNACTIVPTWAAMRRTISTSWKIPTTIGL
ncbi:MAG: hypothetical protein LUD46_19710 [Parabacteroides sp.]|nr:hypothetical protein [Parabacteroides sp.]